MFEIRATRATHPYRRQDGVIELRFRFHAEVKDWVKRCLYEAMDLEGCDGGWNAERRCWWIDESAWTPDLRCEIGTYPYGLDVAICEDFAERAERTNPPKQAPTQRQPHDVLGVPITASLGEIKAAYMTLIKQYHPDKIPPDLAPEFRDLANQRAKEINGAFDVLSRGRRS